MFQALLRWLRGFLIISVSGSFRDRFFNICSRNNIFMWNIVHSDDCVTARVSKKDYIRIEPYIEKTGVACKTLDKKGLPFFFYKYKKRKCFVLGFLCCLGIIYTFTLFVWDVNIDGQNMYTGEQIRKDIIDNYVPLGTLKCRIDCAELETQLREQYDQIAWISCELRGTQLNIVLTETVEPDMIEEQTEPCNITAVKDGIITDIITRAGTPVVSAGDEVKKGDILITGVVNIYNDYDELLETRYIPASGDVYAIVRYTYEDTFPMQNYEKKYIGKAKNSYSIGFAGHFLSAPGKGEDNDSTDRITEYKKLVLAGDFFLPITIRKTTTKQYETVPVSYTEKQARDKAERRLQNFLDNIRKKGVEILENNVTIEFEDGNCIVSGYITAKELIGVPSEINPIKEGETP
ncbi:MAG: sporulation protein YqfD [Wujia sp.]